MDNRSFPINHFKEVHSEEIHEIIGQPPVWIVRWGMTVFSFFLVFLVSASWFVKYPEIIQAKFILTASNAPRGVFVNFEGKITKLLTHEGDTVAQGQNLIYMESAAEHEQILQLERDIKEMSKCISSNDWRSLNRFEHKEFTTLGEIQIDFQQFIQALTTLSGYLSNGFYVKKRDLLLLDLKDLKALEINLKEQIELQNIDLNLGKEEYRMQEYLHNNKVIADLELKKEKAKMISREIPAKGLAYTLIQNRSLQAAKQKEILELDHLIQDQKISFAQALRSLQSSIASWKKKFIIVAPVSGRVSFSTPLQEQFHVLLNQELLSIEPSQSNYEGIMKITQLNIGKLSENQTVLIKLDGYPFKEYGMLQGSLRKLSSTPAKDSTYWAYVSLPRGLTTRYGRSLAYRNGLKGQADVITADRSLLERITSALRTGR